MLFCFNFDDINYCIVRIRSKSDMWVRGCVSNEVKMEKIDNERGCVCVR